MTSMESIIKWPLGGSPIINLAGEEIVYRNCGGLVSNHVLLWVNRSSVIAGRMSRDGLDYSCYWSQRLGVPVFRRFTGGGAVYHDSNILSITLIGEGWGTLRKVYWEGTRIIIEALSILGLRGWVANEGDIVVGDCKVGGSAAHIGRGVFLYHATLNYNLPGFVMLLTPPRHDRIKWEGIDPVKYKPCSLELRVPHRDAIVNAIVDSSTSLGYKVELLWNIIRKCMVSREIIDTVVRRVRDPQWNPCIGARSL